MVYKQFSAGVIIRISLLLANMLCLAYIFARTDLFFTQLILLFALIYQIYNLIRFVTQTNRELSKFLLAIQHRDYSVTFDNHTLSGQNFRELNGVFREIVQSYQQVDAKRESQYQFFKRMFQQVNVGIISLDSKQEIVLMNKAAHELLQVPEGISWQVLQTKRPSFTTVVESEARNSSYLTELRLEEELKQLSIRIDTVVLLGESMRILIFQDIKNEIEQKETEAWYKLIRILTHEIMNSLTPVVSLTETMLMILGQEKGTPEEMATLTKENIEDLRFSLQTIQKRSTGLLHFLNDYRKLTRIPVPQVESINVAGIVADVAALMQGEFAKQQVNFHSEVKLDQLTIVADPKLISQVLINLLTNSLQALESVENAAISLQAHLKEQQVLIELKDNGKGIDADKLDKIFIPFYSTKPEGSGIGLSLCRQIMGLHNGSIKVYSSKGIYTRVVLSFPLA
ncbi:GHKL domain-containing protein [Rhodocytophaga rosea]|uniref:histidine kinase n=1 Tax=Rhodocytophaga rosea TaxID=2704465 RepID=A0A6C0GTJ6_9BACT|nr:ATP-binding protein [Rhodocytophaga rosea]QHT71346.1 GHKL domain-containing protein [Rhodocytophaga rosea]